jgi:hypothetical protein
MVENIKETFSRGNWFYYVVVLSFLR